MSIRATRIVKFIRKGDKGSDAVRYWLIPSVSTVVLSNIESGDGTPTPSTVSCRLVKQVGDDSPTTIAAPSSVGLTISYSLVGRLTTVAPQTYSGGSVNVPTNTQYTAIEFYLYQGSTLIDTATIGITRDGEQGEPGNDAVDYDLLTNVNAVKADYNGTPTGEAIFLTAYRIEGSQRSQLALATSGTPRYYAQYSIDSGTWTDCAAMTVTLNGAHTSVIGIASNIVATIKSTVQFRLRHTSDNGTPLKVIAALKVVKDGAPGQTGGKGDRGPALRGPQAWSDCATGYAFQAGGDSEAWKDVVMYGDNYYSCIKSHTKTASNYPGSTTDQNNKYWQLGDKIELVATKILLATYALVKNLGVECIDMKDANGNVLFQAKDGNVTCKTGTFENIKVTGDITAEYLNLKTSTAAHEQDTPTLANGAICNDASGIILPELPQGTARSMRVLNPLITRTSPQNLVLKPASTNVYISQNLSWYGAVNTSVTLKERGSNAGFYVELIGIGEKNSNKTYWLMSEMTPGLIS